MRFLKQKSLAKTLIQNASTCVVHNKKTLLRTVVEKKLLAGGKLAYSRIFFVGIELRIYDAILAQNSLALLLPKMNLNAPNVERMRALYRCKNLVNDGRRHAMLCAVRFERFSMRICAQILRYLARCDSRLKSATHRLARHVRDNKV